ncbi:ABC transporter substrate-binding protein [Paralcaligenes ureilyticus]|uniref:Putative spermidine/putrescine transport system substrate-binding protein n=1 Tax=Paralcaligenes ureilyticus TaxID=627131 RepID=A0A4R3MDC6_9BURK|nr:extracellular solute-binding protein [Paralcaligenes ureilyticus]TCT10269.1 putative spermidine/putrescine transport system substrate-binding protein [Paralcaligenes ureilyticus]
MGTNISRRQFNLMLGAAAATSMSKAFAIGKPKGNLVVGTWGGDYGKFLREYIITPFVDPQGITTALAVAQEPPRKIKLLAERPLPHGTMDVAALTFDGMSEMWKNGVLQKLDISRIPRYAGIAEFLKNPYSVPHIYTGRVILYNPDKVKTAPTSYEDLWDPKYAGKVGVIDIQYSTTIESAALISGGSLSNFEPGKKKLLELKKMGVRVYPTNESMAQALGTGECWMCIMWLARARQWQDAGAPVKVAYPKEGVMVYGNGWGIPKNARNVDAAYAYINATLEPKAQIAFAQHMGYIPPMTANVLPAKLAERVAIPDSEIKNVKIRDYDYLLKNDSQLQNWWNKVFKG